VAPATPTPSTTDTAETATSGRQLVPLASLNQPADAALTATASPR
jgi:hypothetical protein